MQSIRKNKIKIFWFVWNFTPKREKYLGLNFSSQKSGLEEIEGVEAYFRGYFEWVEYLKKGFKKKPKFFNRKVGNKPALGSKKFNWKFSWDTDEELYKFENNLIANKIYASWSRAWRN